VSRGGTYRSLQPKPTPCKLCGAPIFFVISTGTNRRIPCDPEAVEDGDTVVLQDGVHADVLGPDAARAWVGRKYRCHFATCPQTRAYRRKRGIPEPASTKEPSGAW